MQTRLFFRHSCLTVLAISFIGSAHAADQTWVGGATGNNTGWLTGTNWSGLAIPGSTSTTTNTDIATLPATGTNPALGIAGTTYYLGAVNFTSTANRAIGASGTTGANLTWQLNGATVNGVANTILRASSTGTLTLQANNGQATPNTLVLALGNTTNNVINIDSSGGININVAISGAGRNLTLNGNSTGILTFGGTAANTYSGVTTVNVGELDLNKTAGTDAIAGNLTVGDGVGAANSATVKLLAANQINNNSDVTINSDGVLNLNGNAETIDGLISLSSTSSVALGTGTLTVGANNDPGNPIFTGVISGVGGNLIKTGTGTQTLAGNNTFTGTTTINGGTLEIYNPNTTAQGRLSGTSSVTVNSGGTLLLDGSATINDRVNDTAAITLNGGTLRTLGVQEGTTAAAGVGALTLSSSSIINLQNTSLLHFAASNGETWTGTLSIYNWSGTFTTGGGAEQLLFGSNTTALTQAQLDQISFYSDNGTTFLGTAAWATIANGEIVPVPEPATWINGALVLGLIGWTQRTRFARKLTI